jgi:hypothetical protein
MFCSGMMSCTGECISYYALEWCRELENAFDVESWYDVVHWNGVVYWRMRLMLLTGLLSTGMMSCTGCFNAYDVENDMW